jgi:hypothetical protein
MEKIRKLVIEGATIVGAPPKHASGLKDYPENDRQVSKIAAELWGEPDGKQVTERRVGKGRVIRGRSPLEILKEDGVIRDFSFTGQDENSGVFDYIHRSTGEAEIFYVINRTAQAAKNDFSFRVTGKQPELWDPVTGKIRKAEAFYQDNGATIVPIELDRFGSLFIVFSSPVSPGASGSLKSNFPELRSLAEPGGPWRVTFDTLWSSQEEAEFTSLVSWTTRKEESIKHYSGTAVYTRKFDLPDSLSVNPGMNGRDLYLDLGDVRCIARVYLNGHDLGVLWCPPWRVEITGYLEKKDNILKVKVTNLWANRVIGDLNLPPGKRYTKTHDIFRFDELRAATPLIESGLLGPVRILEGTAGNNAGRRHGQGSL